MASRSCARSAASPAPRRRCLCLKLLTFHLLMAICARLRWARACAVDGQNVKFSLNYSGGGGGGSGSAKVKLIIQPELDQVPMPLRIAAVGLLDGLITAADHGNLVIVDRGHRFSSGVSEICLWFRPARVPHFSPPPGLSTASPPALVSPQEPTTEEAPAVLVEKEVSPPKRLRTAAEDPLPTRAGEAEIQD